MKRKLKSIQAAEENMDSLKNLTYQLGNMLKESDKLCQSKDLEISQLKQELETFKDGYVERNAEVNKLKADKEELVESLKDLMFRASPPEREKAEQLIQKHKQ